ncbi:cytochrome-c oxidase, cbb3-type subunit III [Elioraea tepidiphila]|uniref:cytochrome-c oxidase, cbb3-type subunit III n=1 Tax=Elioraea tepidiphila TaxID=457934 RepID=UPI00036ED72F|nr:cytochrome-c oxidase, cbb3-type subunit III [Elioraea tepidiphila]
MPTKIEKDAVTGKETTGHEWDGIKELNTPLPKWWLYILYATIAWSVVWAILYPSFPGLSGHWRGTTGWTQRTAIAEQMRAVDAERAPMLERIRSAGLEELRRDPDLLQYAMAGGRVAFADNCAACHGAGGEGRPGGFPSLADDSWIWGGTLEDIHTTILHGIRNTQDPDARMSMMPAYGQILSRQEIDDVAEHVLSFTGRSTNAESAARGATIYADQCVACHGEKGEGVREQGGPALNDAIWLYGGSKREITAQIANPRMGVMPPWQGRLDEATIRMLTVYVHTLGGGE